MQQGATGLPARFGLCSPSAFTLNRSGRRMVGGRPTVASCTDHAPGVAFPLGVAQPAALSPVSCCAQHRHTPRGSAPCYSDSDSDSNGSRPPPAGYSRF
eukprot:364586-Chlamydomonas_euryale.AAC.12